MLGYSPQLEVYGIAINAYKSIMNTNINREHIIKNLIKNKTRNIDFIGSFMVFDYINEGLLQDHYLDTTEGEKYSRLKQKLVQKIVNSSKKYIALTIGSIMYTNNVSHHVSVILQKKTDTMIIKVINSGLYYLSRSYGDVIDNLLRDVSRTMGKKVIFHHPYIGKMWMGLSFWQSCNPQDYCRGGAIGELSTFVYYTNNIHRESYCQTWCIMMLKHEIDIINDLKNQYNIGKSYFTDWPTDKKTLEIKLREFILWLVVKYEKEVDFDYEFRVQLESECIEYKDKTKFSKILLNCFRTLHPEIKIPKKL